MRPKWGEKNILAKSRSQFQVSSSSRGWGAEKWAKRTNHQFQCLMVLHVIWGHHIDPPPLFHLTALESRSSGLVKSLDLTGLFQTTGNEIRACHPICGAVWHLTALIKTDTEYRGVARWRQNMHVDIKQMPTGAYRAEVMYSGGYFNRTPLVCPV